MNEYFEYPEAEEDYAYTDENTISQFEESRKLVIIAKFKSCLDKEPEFYGVDNICSQEILHSIENMKTDKCDFSLTEYQIELFGDLYMGLYYMHGNINIYNHVAKFISSRVYV